MLLAHLYHIKNEVLGTQVGWVPSIAFYYPRIVPSRLGLTSEATKDHETQPMIRNYGRGKEESSSTIMKLSSVRSTQPGMEWVY